MEEMGKVLGAHDSASEELDGASERLDGLESDVESRRAERESAEGRLRAAGEFFSFPEEGSTPRVGINGVCSAFFFAILNRAIPRTASQRNARPTPCPS